jgi:relaxase-like protein
VARAAPGDPVLSDAQWARVAEEIMHRTGLARSGDDEAVRWVAVRHAPDHIHIVATLARQDGTKPRIWNDYFRVREACLAVERQYGLLVTAPGDRTAGRRPTRAENEDARRRGWEEPARITLRRAVHTAAAGSEQEFFVRVEAAGLLVRRRFSQRDPGQVTGYALAKPGHVNGQGRQCGSVAGSSLPT